MMRGTPRTFVGTTVFELAASVCRHVSDAVRSEVGGLPGVARCDLDVSSRTMTVTARTAVDRNDVVAVLDRLGCPVRG